MKINTHDTIVFALHNVKSKADKLNSIEEKRTFYKKYLKDILPYLSIDEEIDYDSIEIDEILTDYFLNVRIDKINLFEGEGYHPWLNDKVGNINWRFYNRYDQYLVMKKHWNPNTVASIRNTSDIILDHLADPTSDKYFNKIGLVMGDIQSGKTANYTALINKCIDAGYKIIIVLAGMTKDLRNQTQNRLDKEVLGYETKGSTKGKKIGVGQFSDLHIEGLTYADELKDYGEFKKYFSIHTLDNNLNPVIAIVKKNVSVLENLCDFLTSSQEFCYDFDEEGNKKLKIPVLIIDDEVDQASVNTSKDDNIEGASAINASIRKILSKLARYSYVGYTATPFANMFINAEEKTDIYPKDFILYIPTPEGYSGIEDYFGIDISDQSDETSDNDSKLFVNIDDYKQLFSNPNEKLNAQSVIEHVNNSLQKAIKDFILACAIKKSRGFIEHNSMLIHIARFKTPSNTLRPVVQKYVNDLMQSFNYSYDTIVKEFYNIWKNDFEPLSKRMLGEKFKDNWHDIEKYLTSTVHSVTNGICVLNGDSGDLIDYESTDKGDHIIIGGDKLSRGLTLNGLITSYYYRQSKMYDSTLQMGRWFGYRKGWLDICRVYTSKSFKQNFIIIGKVIQRFKKDLDEMFRMRLNPREVGQRILYSSNLIPTARNKMRNSTKMKVSFSGEVQQLISFDKNNIDYNRKITIDFINELGDGELHENNKVVFKNIDYSRILNYLKNYKEYGAYDYGQISIKNWINYIENLVEKNELLQWTVVLNSLNTKNVNQIKVGKYIVKKPTRTLREPSEGKDLDIFKIKTNIDPTDFKEFFDTDSVEYKNIKHYDKCVDYPGFDSKHALLSIYITDIFDKVKKGYDAVKGKMIYERGEIIKDAQSVCSPAIWFPKTNDYEASATQFFVNNDYATLNDEEDDY